jgi:hypothetical protein
VLTLYHNRVPNLPLGYMLFRTWSHYRALNGGKYLEALLSGNLIAPTPSKEMDEMYAAGLSANGSQPTSENSPLQPNEDGETMLLKRWNGKLIAEIFKLPELEIEITRAVDQVEAMVTGETKSEEHAVKDKMTAETALQSPTEKQ